MHRSPAEYSRVQLDIRLSHPIQIQIQLDTIDVALRRLGIRQLHRHGPQIDLGEVQRLQGTGQHGLEHGLHRGLDDL